MIPHLLSSGRAIDLLSPDPRLLSPRLVGAHLARINRYAGGTALPLSVAQHSLLVARLLPAHLRRHGLLHDGHEAIMGDIPGPTKAAIAHLGGGHALAVLEARLDAAIHRACGLPWPLSPLDQARLIAADRRALATEMRDLLGVPPDRLPHSPDPRPLRAMPWAKAEEAWQAEWDRLTEAADLAAAPVRDAG